MLERLKQIRFRKHDLWAALLGVLSFFIFVPIFTYIYFARDLSTKETIMNRNNTGVVLLDRNGQVFFRFYDAHYRNQIALSQVPKDMQHAVIAAEDREFYLHPGFSIKGIVGAIIADVRKKDTSYGGSTITQQLVKNSLLSSKKSFLRKFQEIVLAQEIERRYTKDEILEMYLNSVYFGEGSFGVESAAKTYFGKPAKELTLAEASVLAGLLTAPSQLSPISGDPEKSKARQTYVLDQMVQQKYITAQQKASALKEEFAFNEDSGSQLYKAPHFALMVKKELEDKYGEEKVARSGYVVTTTLDLTWQKFAEETVKDQVEKLKPNRVSNGAAIVMDPKTGEVRALVGSKDWNDDKYGKFNIATSLRQPGSSFKPLVYAAALEQRIITPSTLLKDEPTTFPGNYKPQNYDKKFRGRVTARRSLANSLNVTSVEVLNKLGVDKALSEARKFGYTTFDESTYYGLSLVLGAGEVQLIEHTNAFATLANKGLRNQTTLISEIKDKHENVIYTYNPEPVRVIDPEAAFQVSSILSDNNARAEVFGTVLNLSRPAAVKTGTSESYRDSLTMGYTPSLVVGVWVGNNDGAPMDNIAGSIGAAPIWRALMEKFLQGTPVEKFEPPLGLVSEWVCRGNGLKVKESTSSAYKEYFYRGTEPTQFCNNGPQPTSSGSPAASAQPAPSVQPSPQPSPSTTPPEESKKKEENNNSTVIINGDSGNVTIQNNSSSSQ